MSSFPIEPKVVAALSGAGAGAAIGGFIDWLLGVTIWHASNSAFAASAAVAAVPTPVTLLVAVLLAAAGAGTAGYVAPHAVRVTDQSSVDANLPALDGVAVEDTSSADAALVAAEGVHPLTGPVLTPDKPNPYMGGGRANAAPTTDTAA